MTLLLDCMLGNSLVALVLALVALAVHRLTRRPALAHALWLLVLLKLLTPPLFVLPVSFSLPPSEHHLAFDRPALIWASPSEFSLAALPSSLPLVLVASSLVGTGLFLLLHLFKARRLRRLLADARPAPDDLQAETEVTARRLGLTVPPRVYLTTAVLPPLLHNGRIYFPETLLPRLDEVERASLIAQQLADLSRGEPWFARLERLGLLVAWWNPLAWLAARARRAAAAECADSRVIFSLPGFNASFAGALVETADFLAEHRAVGPFVSRFTSSRHFERRLTMIVRGTAGPSSLTRSGIVVVLLLAASLLLSPVPTAGQAPPTEDAPEETPSAPYTPAQPTPVRPQPVKKVAPPPEEPERYAPSPRTFLNTLGGQITALTLSPDGKTLAVASGETSGNTEGSLTLFDLPAGSERLTLPHSKPLHAVAFSRDGLLLVTADHAGAIHLRDPRSGQTHQTLTGHTNAVTDLALAPDGKTLVSSSLDRSVRLWDLPSGKLRTTISDHEDAVLSVSLSPDGTKLLSTGRDRTARVRELATGKLLHTLQGHTAAVTHGFFSPDGKRLATTGEDNVVKLWNTESGKLLHDLFGHTAAVRRAVFLPDGMTLLTTGDDRTVRLWNVESGTLSSTLETDHTDRIEALARTADGKTLLTGSFDRSARVWDLDSREMRHTLTPRRYLPENQFPILTLAVAPDGQTLAVAGEERAIKLLDPATGQVRRLLEGHEDFVACLTFAPDSKWLASAGFDGTVRLWEVATGKLLHRLEGHTNWVFSAAFSPDGSLLASGGYDRTVRLWNPLTGQSLATLDKHRGSVRAVAFSRDGKLLASAGSDRVIRLWNPATREVVHTLRGHDEPIRGLAFAPDADRLASCSEDATVRLWNIHTATQITAGRLPEPCRALAFSPAGQRLAVVDQTRRVELIDGRSLQPGWKFDSTTGTGFTSVAFSPDAASLYVGGLDRTVTVWRGQPTPRPPLVTFPTDKPLAFALLAPDGRRLAWAGDSRALHLRDARFALPLGALDEAPAAVLGLARSLDGKLLATAGLDRSIRIYDIASRKLLTTLEGHRDRVHSVAFSPDATRLVAASGSADNPETPGEVKVWEIATAKPLLEVADIESTAFAVAWSRDGRLLAVGTRDGRARLLDAATGKLLHDLNGHKDTVRAVRFSPDDRRLATCGLEDGSVRLWDVASGKHLLTLSAPAPGFHDLAWSPDGKRLAAAGQPREMPREAPAVWIWTLRDNADRPAADDPVRLDGHSRFCRACAFSPDGKLLASVGGLSEEPGEALLWEVESRKLLARLHGHRRRCESAIFTPDGRTLITAGGSPFSPGEVFLWNVADRDGTHIPDAHAEPLTCAIWFPDGKTLATGSRDRSIKLWDTTSGKLLHTFTQAHRAPLLALTLHADAKLLASSADDGTVKLWDLATNTEIAELTRHDLPVPALAFSPDGKTLATGSARLDRENSPGRLRLFEISTGKERPLADASLLPTSAIVYSTDGKFLIVGGPADGALRVFDAASGKLLRHLKSARGIRTLALAPRGHRLITAAPNGSLQLWDSTTWTERGTFAGHPASVSSLSFAPDGRFLVSAGQDGSLRLWDLETSSSIPGGSSPPRND